MSRVSFPTLRFRDLALAMDTSIYVAVLSLGLPWVSCSVAICPYPQDGRHPEMIAICISPFAYRHLHCTTSPQRGIASSRGPKTRTRLIAEIRGGCLHNRWPRFIFTINVFHTRTERASIPADVHWPFKVSQPLCKDTGCTLHR